MSTTLRIAAVSVAATVLLFAGCRDHPTEPGSLGGTYVYTAYNAGDTVVVIGTINLANPDSTLLTGRWLLAAVNGAPNIGPQTGSGTLRGSTGPGTTTISIDLNPGWADNNVFLNGTFQGTAIKGTWMWSTFGGPTSEGRFVMTKR